MEPTDPTDLAGPDQPPLPVLSHRAMVWAAAVLMVIGVGLAVGLLVAFGNGQHPQQLDAIKTAGTFVVGTGGGAALWLTARRQRTSELALNQAREAHALQKQVAASAAADAEARRITELYSKAADQLGSDKAPVRLAGLYSLERLAQDNERQRQTIVNVLCAYLRMPFTPPADTPPDDDAEETVVARFEARAQERQVRLTAQRILADHLGPGPGPAPVDTFWPDIMLDLTGATLIDFSLADCRVGDVMFDRAWFTGHVSFSGAEFAGHVSFSGAQFAGTATFDMANFTSATWFHHVRFAGYAGFMGTRFASATMFDGAQFAHDPSSDTQFASVAVRVDVPESAVSTWPAGWELTPTSLSADTEGEWKGLLKTASESS
jgi:hypothetical protein